MSKRLHNLWGVMTAVTLLVGPGCMVRQQSGLTEQSALTPESPVELAETTQVFFTDPGCLPNCTQADKDRLAATGYVENRIVAAIDQATATVDFSMYTFSRKPIFQALVRALERGVTLRGIVDKGLFRNLKRYCTVTGCDLPEPYGTEPYQTASVAERQNLVASDPLYREASLPEKLQLLGYRSGAAPLVQKAPGSRRLVHNKLVLIDGQYLLSGSGNWSSTAVTINLENLVSWHSRSEPLIVESFRCMLDVIWSGDGNLIARDLPSCQTPKTFFAPSRNGEGTIQHRIIQAINESTGPIRIVMHHLVEPDIIAALKDAADRGRSVQVLFDDDDCNGSEPQLDLLRNTRGVEFRFVPTNCQLFQLSHNKFGIFGAELVINGSANWSKAGLTKNYENFALFLGAEQTKPFHDFFDRVWPEALVRANCQCDTTAPDCQERYCLGRTR